MIQLKIGIDVDGVLTDFEWFIDYFGTKYLKKKKLSYSIFRPDSYSFKSKFNCSDDVEHNFFKKHLIWYANHIPIRENAAQTINELKREGHTIYIITARILTDENSILGSLMRFFLRKWLHNNNVKYDSIYFVNFKNSAIEKAELCKKLNLDFYIEDEPTNVEEVKKHCEVICISAKYNNNLADAYLANDFADVYNIITNGQTFETVDKNDQLLMTSSEKEQYFKELRNTIKKLPFDKNAMDTYKLNNKIAINTVGTIFKRIFSMQYVDSKQINCETNAIYVCNHRRSLDIPLAYCILGKTYARFLAKREYQFTPLSIIQKKLGTIYVGREYPASRKSSLMTMLQTVLNGENIFIFPEGTRNKTDDTLLPFKPGAVKIAQITGIPIIPIVIYKINKFKYKVIIGEMFKVSVFDDLDNKNQELWKIMRNVYIQLKEESK